MSPTDGTIWIRPTSGGTAHLIAPADSPDPLCGASVVGQWTEAAVWDACCPACAIALVQRAPSRLIDVLTRALAAGSGDPRAGDDLLRRKAEVTRAEDDLSRRKAALTRAENDLLRREAASTRAEERAQRLLSRSRRALLRAARERRAWRDLPPQPRSRRGGRR